MTALATIGPGHNSPSPAEIASGIREELRLWTTEHPVIQTDDEAREAARLVQRAKNTLADLDAERKAKGRPHLDSIHAINTEYHDAMRPINLGKETIEERMTAWAKAEEKRRQEIAAKILLAAKEAQQRASDAIRAAQEAEQNASFGEAVDVVGAKQEAVAAFNDARRADRAFARAEREAEHVRLAPGLGARSMSLRSHEVLSVTNPTEALAELGLTEGIAEAILTAARAYRRLHSRLPAGIATRTERTV